MARLSGRTGSVYCGITGSSASAEAVAFLSSWSLSATTDKYDVTAFGDTTKTYVQGLPDAQGQYEGFFDNATAQTYTAASDGNARRFYLYTQTPSTAGPYWFGTALLDFEVTTPVTGPVAISGSWAAATPFFKVG